MLLKSDFHISSYDTELFIHDIKRVYVTVYVDDVHLRSSRIKDLNWVKVEIAVNYKIKNVRDSNHYLNMKIERNFNSFILFQPFFIKNLLKEFSMNDCHSTSISMEENVDFINDNEKLIVYTTEFTLHFYQLNIEFL